MLYFSDRAVYFLKKIDESVFNFARHRALGSLEPEALRFSLLSFVRHGLIERGLHPTSRLSFTENKKIKQTLAKIPCLSMTWYSNTHHKEK